VSRVGRPWGAAPKPPVPDRASRRNDSNWRNDCLTRRGRVCRAAGEGGCGGGLQVDHVVPRSPGGPSVISNGLVLCAAHHTAKTESRLLIRPQWLDADQVAFLAEFGWVAWQADGQPQGRGWRHFESRGGRAWPSATTTGTT
jgi:hypothetical protein